MAQERWLYHVLQRVPSRRSPRLAGSIVGMCVERASLVDRERQNAPGTSQDAATVEKLELSAAILTESERSRNGENCFPTLILLAPLNADTHASSHFGRQLASLSAKVQAYEDVIRKLSNRFGVSDEQLVDIALAVVRSLTRLQLTEPCLRNIRTRLLNYP